MSEVRQPAIEMLPASELLPYARNPRHHPVENIAKIAASIREFGWTVPVLISDDNHLVAGHGRLLAAHSIGITEVPCIRLRNLTPAQLQAYRIADNQIALDSEWDMELLKAELGDLVDLEFDLAVLGFSDKALEELLKAAPTGLELDGGGGGEREGAVHTCPKCGFQFR